MPLPPHIKPTKPSKKVEIVYKKELIQYLKTIRNQVDPAVLQVIETVPVTDKKEEPIPARPSKYNEIIKAAEAALNRELLDKEAEHIANRVVPQSFSYTRNSIEVALGKRIQKGMMENKSLRSLMIAEARENANQIKSLPDQYIEVVARKVDDGVMQGYRHEKLARELSLSYNVNVSRAKLIARTETAKLNSVVSKHLYKQAGLNRYVWLSSLDSRVRSDHLSAHGKTFTFDLPSNGKPRDEGTGLDIDPGETFNCRCVAGAIVE